MTPCDESGSPNFDALVRKGQELVEEGMSSVVYCGSMGDWPLLSEEHRRQGVNALIDAGLPVIVGTGAQNTQNAVAHAVHAKASGARGLMIIPRVLSRGTSPTAQRAHLAAVLEAGVDLPSVIYNSPYYGFETKAELFFDLRKDYPHLVGFKEFGGAEALSYTATHHQWGGRVGTASWRRYPSLPRSTSMWRHWIDYWGWQRSAATCAEVVCALPNGSQRRLPSKKLCV